MSIDKTFSSKPEPEIQDQPSNKKLLTVTIIIAMILFLGFLGIGLGYWYNQLPENNPQRDRVSCEQAGGEWLTDQSTCLISNRVAGEICTDGGQCQSGVCFPPALTQEQQAALSHGDVTGITGTCYSEELMTDCVKQVIDGTVSRESLCLE